MEIQDADRLTGAIAASSHRHSVRLSSMTRVTGNLWSSPGTPSLTVLGGRRLQHRRLVCGHIAALLPGDGTDTTLGVVGVRAGVHLQNASRIYSPLAANSLTPEGRALVFVPAHVLMHVIPADCYRSLEARDGQNAAAQGLDYQCVHANYVVPDENDYIGVVGTRAKAFFRDTGQRYDEATVNRQFHVADHEELVFTGNVNGQHIGGHVHMLASSCLARHMAIVKPNQV